MSDTLIITHSGIVITYDENGNKFKFELRGRQRSAESLAKARETIDKPVTEKEEKTFKPVECWHKASYGDEFKKVKVTSVAEALPYETARNVWISDQGVRSKVRSDSIYLITGANNALVERYKKLNDEIAAKAQELRDIVEKLEQLKIP